MIRDMRENGIGKRGCAFGIVIRVSEKWGRDVPWAWNREDLPRPTPRYIAIQLAHPGLRLIHYLQSWCQPGSEWNPDVPYWPSEALCGTRSVLELRRKKSQVGVSINTSPRWIKGDYCEDIIHLKKTQFYKKYHLCFTHSTPSLIIMICR